MNLPVWHCLEVHCFAQCYLITTISSLSLVCAESELLHTGCAAVATVRKNQEREVA